MARRTTILLDEESDGAARDLAHRLRCSTSEAIRQAILRYRDQTVGVPLEKRRERVAALKRLIALMDGQDGEAEIRRLKEEDAGS